MNSGPALSLEHFESSLRAMMAKMSPEELEEFSDPILQAVKSSERDRLSRYRPYQKQISFHEAGKTEAERLLMAANQVGKTMAGAAETAMHLTGRYPDTWKGRRFDKPVRWLAGSESAELTRKGVQRLLVGEPEDESKWGTGMIPGACIETWDRKQGVPNTLDNIVVKHEAGDNSVLEFKSYDQGRAKWQSDTVDGVWFDEEPPADVYTEGITRTNVRNGIVFVTFTPLLGMSEVVSRFLIHKRGHVTTMTIEDAGHYTPEQRKTIIAKYLPHEVEARTKGVPIMGSGRVFPVTEDSLSETAIQMPEHWPRIAGLDIGTDHPTALVWMAHDRDTDTVHVYDCYRVSGEVIAVHASAIRSRGQGIPVAWPHDALKRDGAKTGEAFAELYRKEGVQMLHTFAQFDDDRGFSREAGIAEMLGRMRAGRLKVAAHLNDWWEEFRLYHRKNGIVVDERDDLMAATRYALVMLRYAQVPAPMLDLGRLTPKWTRV